MPTRYEVNKAAHFKKVGYTPMPHQQEFHNSKARFRCAVCGRRTGKSTMVARDKEATLLLPNTLGWIVGPTYDLGAKEFAVMWKDLIKTLQLGRDKRVKKNFSIKSGDMYIEFPWGSRVEVRSAQYPDTLVGEGLDWAILAEAAKLGPSVWDKAIRPALSDKRGSADALTTPEGKNWLYEFWKRGREGRVEYRPNYQSWQFPSWVNTVRYPGGFMDPEIQDMLETTDESWFKQEIAADFTAIVGRIYAEFDEEVHVKPHVYNPDWPNYMAFDWGFANPLAAVEFQVSPMDTIHVWREHYKTDKTLEWHINYIKERVNPEGYRLDGIYGDAADPDAVEYVSQHLGHCHADPESKQWMPGIRLVKKFLKPEQMSEADRDEDEVPILTPRYFVDPECNEHIDEMLGYKYKENVSADEFKGAGVVAKGVADHTLDAVRYALMHLFEVGVQHHLDEVYPEWAKNDNREYQKQKKPVTSRVPETEQVEKELVGAAESSSTFFSFNMGSMSRPF